MSLSNCKQTTEKTPQRRKLNFSITNWPADLSLKQQNMYSKNTLALNQVMPSNPRLQTVHKYQHLV